MYVPLRVHGNHSLLMGVDAPEALLERAAGLGFAAMALTDVDSTAGWVDFLREARRRDLAAGDPAPDGGVPGRTARDGDAPERDTPEREAPADLGARRLTGGARANPVRPILGAELSDTGGRPGRITALVETEAGFRNLNRLVSARQLGRDPGEHGADLGTPEEDFDLVRAAVRYQDGLIYLVDHPRVLLGLMGRVDPSRVLAALSPAGLAHRGPASRGRSRRARTGEARNTHLLRGGSAPASGDANDRANDDAPPTSETHDLDPAKPPPPAAPVPVHEMLDAARATGFGVVAVPDVYCAYPAGMRDHRLRVAIQRNALVNDLPEEWLAARPAHLLTGRELCAIFADVEDVAGPWGSHAPPGVPPMVARTVEVAARCRYTPPLDRVLFPKADLAEGETAYSRLCALSFDGAKARYTPLRPEVVRRLDHELSTIDRLGFAAYFLLVHRIAEYAKGIGVPCVGRGSAADSLVAYCLGLTDADPFRYELIFERFLNPSRSDRPDIDLDFCWRRRDEVIEHVYALFGAERTAMISTLNRFGLRSAFRETALAEGIPPAEVNRWSKLVPHYAPGSARADFDGDTAEKNTAEKEDDGDPRRGPGGASLAREVPRETSRSALLEPPPEPGLTNQERLAAERARAERLTGGGPPNVVELALRSSPEARGFPFDDERWARVLRHAEALLDAPRHHGLHPGGVVVAPGPITDVVACQRAAKGVVVTQFDKDAVEAIGLVKMDLLGNRALTVVDDCLRSLAARGVTPDLERVDEDDPRTAALLREGRTIGCFQVESPGMRNLLKQTGAADMDAVIQAVALIRPGPAGSGMKDAYVRRFRGLEDPAPPHPRLVDLLCRTQGVMLYQEDVMQVAARLAGMDLAEADSLRRALKKRDAHRLEALAERFLAGCVEQGVPRAEAAPVWELIANFASFGFCKAHAVTYGRISYRCAWLKAHHPADFLCAFLESDTGYYRTRVYIEEARRMGVRILGPDVNRSAEGFRLEALGDGGPVGLRVGLRSVKGLTQRTRDAILAGRERGAFLSLPDFLSRTGARTDECETLIQCGAFDAFDRTRPELSWRLHLLRAQPTRPPRQYTRGGADGLDLGQLAACRDDAGDRGFDAARAGTGGWRGGALGLGAARLAPGETAGLFPEPETPALVLPGLPNPGRAERGALEYELLGMTVGDHPLAVFPCAADERITARFGSPAAAAKPGKRGPRPVNPITCAALDRHAGARVTLRGWPAASRRVHTADGRWMRFLTLEDETGLAEVVLFADVYQRDGHRLAEFGPLCVTGVVQDQMGACTLDAERVW